MKSFTITENDSGQRLDKFISKAVPLLPQGLMYKYIRKKRIKVNNARAEISLRLNPGDTVQMYINDEFFAPVKEKYDFLSAGKKLNIIYEDENIILCDKPMGLLCHPDDREYIDTLIGRIKRYLYEKGEFQPEKENSFTPSLVNRIDRNTSGIVIGAKTAQALRILNQKMKGRELKKYYMCIVHGTPNPPESTLTGYLEKDEEKNKVKIKSHPFEQAKIIKTKYKTLRSAAGYSLLEIDLLTGRTHQIRAHMASVGHPLLGDGKYGTNKLNKGTGYKKQALCSYKLVFNFNTPAGELDYLNQKVFEVKNPYIREQFDELTNSKNK